MNAYVFNADLYCEDCSVKIINDLDINVKDSGDSNEYPQGPLLDGGGESDCPQHCNDCKVFLENPLTAEGYEYVYETAAEKVTDTVQIWLDYYDIDSTEYRDDLDMSAFDDYFDDGDFDEDFDDEDLDCFLFDFDDDSYDDRDDEYDDKDWEDVFSFPFDFPRT